MQQGLRSARLYTQYTYKSAREALEDDPECSNPETQALARFSGAEVLLALEDMLFQVRHV